MQALAARQYRGFASVASDPRFPPELRHLVWREWAETAEGRARAEAEIAALPPGDPQIRRFEDRPVAQGDTDDWLATAPLAAPLRASCDALCPASPVTCRRAAFFLVGRARPPRRVRHALGDADPARDSGPRAHAARKRSSGRRSARHRFAYETATAVRKADACLADALAAEVAHYFE